MNRLFITTLCGFLLALTASSATSYWLALNPPFQVDSVILDQQLEAMGETLFTALEHQPEYEWEEVLDNIAGIDGYYIDWFDAIYHEGPVEDLATMDAGRQVLSYLADGTPLLEILFNREQIVLELMPLQGYEKRYWLNATTTVLSVLVIGLLAAALTLVPIARRIGRLQLLARKYSDGNFAERNVDTSTDSIGKLGCSMEAMADQVQGLLSHNEQLVADQQELMRAVAHEFRAPMARMRFALEMHEDTALVVGNHHEISTALDELDGLVTEVLRYARLQHSAPDLTTTEVLLHNMVTQACSAVQAVRPDIPVEIELPAETVEISVDPVQFQRALRNLVSNALKYTTTMVSVRCQSGPDGLLLHVDDNGSGIAAEHRQSILAPFVRLDSSRTRARGGSGLGLAIANGVILKHGGVLSISDSPEGGARFTVSLPAGA